jgi:hypothetical protein
VARKLVGSVEKVIDMNQRLVLELAKVLVVLTVLVRKFFQDLMTSQLLILNFQPRLINGTQQLLVSEVEKTPGSSGIPA